MDYIEKLRHYYYLDLSAALADLAVSKAGVQQIKETLPLTDARDRNAVRRILGVAIGFRYQEYDVVKLNWEFTRLMLLKLGFSDKGVEEIGKEHELTLPDDRKALLNILTKLLIRNESAVPGGLPPHMRNIWKARRAKS